MSEARVEVEIEADGWDEFTEVTSVVDRAARAALEAASAEGSVTVLLTDDGEQAQLNARFRGREGSTNVLSFPAPQTARPHLGDLSLALETCRAEARDQSKPFEHHLAHLVVHGVLHLLGRDHTDEAEAEAMEAEERTILAGLGIPDPYRAAETPS